tara:strand:+ start:736 stop:990 length:255 start_codon:yes stop_codon:yes gene_type:complete
MAKQMRTKADLLNDPRVVSMWKEDVDEMGDGGHWWWLDLAPGYIHEMNQTTSLHEATIATLIDMMKGVVKQEEEAFCFFVSMPK